MVGFTTVFCGAVCCCPRRPLKLTGWELWLCGASNGPLFASVEQNTTAFDGSEVTPEVRWPLYHFFL